MLGRKKKESVLDSFESSIKRRDEEYGDYGILKCKMKELVEKYNEKLYGAGIYGNYGSIQFLNPIPDGIQCEIETLGLKVTKLREDNNYYGKSPIYYTDFDLKLKENTKDD